MAQLLGWECSEGAEEKEEEEEEEEGRRGRKTRKETRKEEEDEEDEPRQLEITLWSTYFQHTDQTLTASSTTASPLAATPSISAMI